MSKKERFVEEFTHVLSSLAGREHDRLTEALGAVKVLRDFVLDNIPRTDRDEAQMTAMNEALATADEVLRANGMLAGEGGEGEA